MYLKLCWNIILIYPHRVPFYKSTYVKHKLNYAIILDFIISDTVDSIQKVKTTFSVRLLSVLRGQSFFSSPPQRPMTSDFEGFSMPDLIHYIIFYLNSWEMLSLKCFFENMHLNWDAFKHGIYKVFENLNCAIFVDGLKNLSIYVQSSKVQCSIEMVMSW